MVIWDESRHDCQLVFGYDVSTAQSSPVKLLHELIGEWSVNCYSGKFASGDLAETMANEELADKFFAFHLNYPCTQAFGVYAKSKRVHQIDDTAYENF